MPGLISGEALLAFIRLGRPHFLFGGFVLYGLGAAVAVTGGATINPAAYALGQGAITALQLMTHYANDYFDLAADRANATPTRWSGGSRVLPSGALSPRVALLTAVVLAAVGAVLAILASIVAARAGADDAGGPDGWVAVAVFATLVSAGVLAWFYSAPPLVLHSRGLGELTTAIVVTGLTPLAGFLLTDGALSRANAMLPVLGAALFPLAGLQFAMLLAIEFPDAAGDAATGKRTLVVRWGTKATASLGRAILVMVYGSLPLLALGGLPTPVVVGGAVGFPIAAWQFVRLGGGAAGNPAGWESLAFRGVALVVITSIGELTAFAWLAVQG